jgi:O-acetylserine/cysteine efflux transporter
MNLDRRRALVALTVAGLLWGSTVPLSKIALGWLPPGWLTAIRFAVAAAVLLTATRSRLRAAWSPAVLASGAVGYGGTVLLQNAGITRTSVSHAALLIGTAPVLVAIIAAVWHRSVARPVAWSGFAVSLAGVGLVAAGGGGGADLGGDGMVLASVLLSAVFTVGQTRLLRGRDPIAVTAVQFLGAALATAPLSALTEGMPPAPAHPATLLAVVALIVGGTLLPFTLFAFGQSRLPAEIAGAFLNIEPLVGAVAGVVAFGNPAGPAQMGGGAAILGGIALSSVRRPGRRTARAPVAVPAGAVPAVAGPGLAEQALAGQAVTGQAAAGAGPALVSLAAGGARPAAAMQAPAEQAAAALVNLAVGAGGQDALDRDDGLSHPRPAGDRGCSVAARPAAAHHPAGLLRPGRRHGTGQPPRIGRRRPRGQLRPKGRPEAGRPSSRDGRPRDGRPGDGRRRVSRAAGRSGASRA